MCVISYQLLAIVSCLSGKIMALFTSFLLDDSRVVKDLGQIDPASALKLNFDVFHFQ